MNIDICDSINTHHWQAKDVVKAVKKRVQHKNPKVQLLALTLLETMIKNCGDYVHFQIADRNILQEMIKIVRKKTDMQVRDKILALLDSWQEAFGGTGGKYPQYYWAYEELRRSGVEFPQRSRDAAPIFTPPVTNPLMRHSQAGYGMPNNTSIRLDEAMASEMENLSLSKLLVNCPFSISSLDSMRSVMDLLGDMLQAVNTNDREAVKDEVIVDLVSQCRSNQKKLMQMLTTTGDEELLGQGLILNDGLQSLLVKHDAIASGSPLPNELREPSPRSNEVIYSNPRSTEQPRSNATPTSPIAVTTSNQLEEEEEENDDFAQLARRRTKDRVVPSESTPSGIEGVASSSVSNIESQTTGAATSTPIPSNALALPDPPNPVRTTTKEQDMIDLLSITLSTGSASPNTPLTPPSTSNQTMHQVPVSPITQGYPYGAQPFPGYQGQAPFNNYVVPWAQPQSNSISNPQLQPQLQAPTHPQPQAQSQPQPQPQQPQYPQYSVNYPPPPWATSSTNSNLIQSSASTPYPFLTPRANAPASYSPPNGARPLQNYNSFPVYGETQMNSTQHHASSATGTKPFVPSYRLFEDLNVLGKSDGGPKTTTSTSTLSGMSGQSMVSRK
ncbi:hypothetical protein IFM89_001539 [Coptis chinensis]|uniref:Uncharacterized protein n=1 Tax=Coptis chinensis TaxID=261450 RepID=A0A835HCI8_9MAGN|nr:hypothetical protein IFM89_001539 [Coptis chinensis]